MAPFTQRVVVVYRTRLTLRAISLGQRTAQCVPLFTGHCECHKPDGATVCS